MPHPPSDLGPLEPLLADSAITAVYITAHAIRYEKDGVMHTSAIMFESDAQRRDIIESIVAAGGASLSPANPVVDCVLTDGTRVHATYHPLELTLHKLV